MKKLSLLLFILILPLCDTVAHTINYVMESQPVQHVFLYYLQLGFTHILPLGYDHLLFILGLFLINPEWRSLLMQATFFTIAHSITLILTANDTIIALPEVIEPLIAITIVFIAIENIYIKKATGFRYFLVFAFGLIHGMGFAGALNETGLPRNSFYTSLIGFNVGVELGQISFILLILFSIGLLQHKNWYRTRIAIPLSLATGAIALWWTIERVFMT
jgi:HupE / UreJ protein